MGALLPHNLSIRGTWRSPALWPLSDSDAACSAATVCLQLLTCMTPSRPRDQLPSQCRCSPACNCQCTQFRPTARECCAAQVQKRWRRPRIHAPSCRLNRRRPQCTRLLHPIHHMMRPEARSALFDLGQGSPASKWIRRGKKYSPSLPFPVPSSEKLTQRHIIFLQQILRASSPQGNGPGS